MNPRVPEDIYALNAVGISLDEASIFCGMNYANDIMLVFPHSLYLSTSLDVLYLKHGVGYEMFIAVSSCTDKIIQIVADEIANYPEVDTIILGPDDNAVNVSDDALISIAGMSGFQYADKCLVFHEIKTWGHRLDFIFLTQKNSAHLAFYFSQN